jgi:hypothetical protein
MTGRSGGLGSGRLIPVEANKLRVGVAQLRGKCLGPDLRLPPPAGEEADHAGGAEEDGEVDEILLIGDRQRPHRGNEEIVDQQEADRRRQQGRPEPAQDGDHGDHSHIDEDVFPLRGGCPELEQDGG